MVWLQFALECLLSLRVNIIRTSCVKPDNLIVSVNKLIFRSLVASLLL